MSARRFGTALVLVVLVVVGADCAGPDSADRIRVETGDAIVAYAERDRPDPGVVVVGPQADEQSTGSASDAPVEGPADPTEPGDGSMVELASPSGPEDRDPASGTDPAADPAPEPDEEPSPPPPEPASPVAHFSTKPVGADLPSGAWCAARVRPSPETRPMNNQANNTRGRGANDRFPRVDGDFVGTTDEIAQWAACKWGIDEDWVRAQMSVESWWDQATGGDLTSDQSRCHPELRRSDGPCPQSIGLIQIKYAFHGEAYENANAIRSTAYNLDYGMAAWRACYEGEIAWLRDVEGGRPYTSGDLQGCMGFWYSGRWHTADAEEYIEDVTSRKRDRVWAHPDFLGYEG